MITVSIFINANPIYTRSAQNTGKMQGNQVEYLSDDGEIVLHDPERGAVALAHKLLDTIKEQK